MSHAAARDAGAGGAIWLSALSVEVAPLLALLDDAQPEEVAERACWRGKLRGQEIRVGVSGPGGSAAESLLSSLLDRAPAECVLAVGTAGALDPELRPGDVVLADRAARWRGAPGAAEPVVLGARGATERRGDRPPWSSEQPFRVSWGQILTWSEPVSGRTAGSRLRARYGADCVDMETGHLARLCDERRISFLAVRAISDRVDDAAHRRTPDDLARAVWHATLVALEALAAGRGARGSLPALPRSG